MQKGLNYNTEQWVDIKGYEGLYKISSLGRVLSVGRTYTTGRNHKRVFTIPDTFKKPVKTKKGYLRVGLNKDGKFKAFQVHRLVAEAFIPNPDNLPEVNHKNEIKDCNTVDNLEWCTTKYNVNYSKTYLRSLHQAVEKTKRAVIQFSLSGELIREWDSISDACEYYNLNPANVCLCCKNQRNKCGNFKWKYKENYENQS